MPRIYVQFSGLDKIGTGCKTVASKVDSIESEFISTVKALDWDIRAASDINNTANRISRKLEQQTKALKAYQRFVNDAYREYVKLDEYGNGRIDLTGESCVIDKSYVLPAVLGIVSPLAGLLSITSGVWKGNTPSFFDNTRTSSSNADADWFGYELSDGLPGVTAWIGKANAEAQNEWGYAGVNAYLGKVDASVKSDFSFMESKRKKEYKDGKWTEQTTTEFLNAELGAGVDVSILAADGEAGIGSDMLGAEVEGELSVGNAELSGKGEFSVGEDGIELNVKGKAMVSAVEGEAKGTINILGLEITGKVGGYAGAVGVEGKFGLDTNEEGKRVFVADGGLAALVGVSAGVEIGFNDTGWDNFVDAVTFWD